ncbi:MAG: hypothetical protein J6Z04_03370 [Clostridia bacterium]|nr:hypothetical protein [Clostridia bacterium]
MHAHTRQNKILSLLLTLAMLSFLFAAFLPVAVSADATPANDGEIEDFGVQTLTALDLAGDEDTDLRFVFTVGSLDYTEVGFVFSKTNAAPEIDGDACYKQAVTAVYSSIVADGDTLTADPGRHWAAIRMTDVPHAYFDGALYVRPFVTDGLGTRYGDAASLTVCGAAGHLHEIAGEPVSSVPATIFGDGSKTGHCDGCNLDGVTEITTSIVEKKYTTSTSTSSQEKRSVTFGEILDGGKHFYPDESNGGLGNDLLVEYSLLWNDTLQNFNKSGGNQTLDSRITNKSGGGTTVLAWMSYQDGAKGSDCPFMGGFEWGAFGTPEDGTSAGMCGSSGAWADYPNIGGADRENPEWGWHRVQIRVHQELTNAAAVASGASAVYYMYSVVYIDGVQVSKLSETGASPAGSLLFTAANDGADGITYTDIADDSILYGFNSQIAKKNSGVGYLVYGDYSVSCGRTFAQSVTRVDSPAAATYVTRADGGVEIPAPAYFTIN